MWGYTPEEALRAPVWVMQVTNILQYDNSFDSDEEEQTDDYEVI